MAAAVQIVVSHFNRESFKRTLELGKENQGADAIRQAVGEIYKARTGLEASVGSLSNVEAQIEYLKKRFVFGPQGFIPRSEVRTNINYSKDFYEILGVDEKASVTEIANAYRAAAMKYHPDRNPDDAEAERRFIEAAEA